MNSINIKKYKGKTGQEIQEEIFRKMPASRKLKLASDINHRIEAEKMYLELAKKYKHWVKVDCVENEKLLSKEEIFRKMPASRKLKLASELTILCLKLRNLNENSKPRKTTDPNGIYS